MVTLHHKPRKELHVQCELSKDGKVLELRVDVLPKPLPSKSGKTLVVATSHGNQPTTLTFGGKVLVVGVNAYIRA